MSATQPLLNKSEVDAVSTEPASPYYQSINADVHQTVSAPAFSSTSSIEAESGEERRVYKRRWYVLILFSLMAGTQGGVWNTFGPISSTVEDAFGWNDGNIGLLTNWGPISFIVAIGPLIWALERKGLRVACLCSAFLIASGTLVRIITMDPPAVTIWMNVGQALNGMAGPVAMAGPPAVSATWFPPQQRTTATALSVFVATFGTAVGFLIGPILVPDVPGNSSHPDDAYLSGAFQHNGSRAAQLTKEKEAIHRLMYIECGWACSIFLAMLIYFPKKPPLPPSISAAIQREDFYTGIKRVFRCLQFWVIGLVYGVSQGVLNCWASVIHVILKPYGISESRAGWIGFIAVCGGCVLSIVVAVLADCMKRAMKWFVLVFYVIGTAAFTVFALAAANYLTPSTVLFMVTIVGGTTVLYAATPLIFELACELVYPTGEGTANGILTLINNIAGGIFLLVMVDRSIGTEWMNWVLMGACALCIPLLFFMKEQYNRLDLDEHNPSLNTSVVVQPPQSQEI